MVMAKWFDPHKDLIERISNFCTTADHIRMQCVCKSWRSILKDITRPELPWMMMLPNGEEEDPDARVFFSLSEQKIHSVRLPEISGKHCCGSFQNGWLMFVDEKLDIFLFHPWSRKRIDLPHHSTLERHNYPYSEFPNEEIRDKEIVKAAISDDGNIVVIAYGLGFLASCRIGDEAYTEIETEGFIDDVIYHKGKFYALTQVASVYLLHIDEDGSGLHVEILTPNLEADFNIPYTIFGYLVGDILTDSVFVITRDMDSLRSDEDEDGLPHKTNCFDIFRVNLEETLEESKSLRRFTKVKSLGDRVLFLGYNSSFVVMASEFRGFKGNCIYFADNMMERHYHSPHGCCDSGVFNLKDGTVEQLFADRFHPILSPPLWIAILPY